MDITQETFLKAARSGNLEEIGNVKAWLFTIARRTFYTEYNSQKRLQSLPENPQVDPKSLHTEMNDVRLFKEEIITGLTKLDPIYAQLFSLHVEYQFNQKEIAGITKIPLRTLQRHFERMKQFLKMKYASEFRDVYSGNPREQV